MRTRLPASGSSRVSFALGPRSKHREKALMQRAQMEGGMRSIEMDALAGIDLGLPIERQMIGIFGLENLSVGNPQLAGPEPRPA